MTPACAAYFSERDEPCLLEPLEAQQNPVSSFSLDNPLSPTGKQMPLCAFSPGKENITGARDLRVGPSKFALAPVYTTRSANIRRRNLSVRFSLPLAQGVYSPEA